MMSILGAKSKAFYLLGCTDLAIVINCTRLACDIRHFVNFCIVAYSGVRLGAISLTYYYTITGSTLVLTCCKGDSSSQWEAPIFGPPQTENPLTDLDKICHQ